MSGWAHSFILLYFFCSSLDQGVDNGKNKVGKSNFGKVWHISLGNFFYETSHIFLKITETTINIYKKYLVMYYVIITLK